MPLGGNSIAKGGRDGSEGGSTLPQLLLQSPLPLPTLRFSRRMQLLLASQHLDSANAPSDIDPDQLDDEGRGNAFSISSVDHSDGGRQGLMVGRPTIYINHNNPLVKLSPPIALQSPSPPSSLSSSSSPSSVWSKSDDELLKSLVLHLGRRWSSIAEIVGRSPEDVMLRYDFKIAPRRLGSWSKVRDPLSLSLIYPRT